MEQNYFHIPNIKSLEEVPSIIWDSGDLPIPIDVFVQKKKDTLNRIPSDYAFWLTANPNLDTQEITKIIRHNQVESIRVTSSKHKTIDDLNSHIKKIESVLGDSKISIALDISGPKVRISKLDQLSGINQLNIIKSDLVVFIPDSALDSIKTNKAYEKAKIIPYKETIPLKMAGKYIFVSDGWVQFEIIHCVDKVYFCEALNDNILFNSRGIDIVGTYEDIDITKQNNEYIEILKAKGILRNIKWLCISFCNRKSDIEEIKNLSLPKHLKLMAKIETKSGLDNISEIASVSDGIMIARGDLAVALSVFSVDMLQAEDQIRKTCSRLKKKCVIATRVGDSLDGLKTSLDNREVFRLRHELSFAQKTTLVLTNEVYESISAYKNFLIILDAIKQSKIN